MSSWLARWIVLLTLVIAARGADNPPKTQPPVAESPNDKKNIGAVLSDPRWSNYGQYLQRMIDRVQIQWERRLVDMKTYPAAGSMVKVQFVLTSQGKVTSLKTVETTADKAASRACMIAISDRAPYGEWTKEMKEALGEQQEMTFMFYYQ
jgi:hypothetical protein